MDRRTFMTLAMTGPAFPRSLEAFQRGRAAKPAPKAAAAKPAPAVAPGVAWTQWGGPKRNFQTEATGLKDVWPATGPRVVWKRALGEGYSAPVVENGVLYTMYGKPREGVVVPANWETGEALWEHVTPMTFQRDAPAQGNGPYSSPLIAGDRLFTTGVAGRLQCLDKKSGKLLWTQQLWSDHHGSQLMYGYSSSPIAFHDTVVVPAGGKGRGGRAFRQGGG